MSRAESLMSRSEVAEASTGCIFAEGDFSTMNSDRQEKERPVSHAMVRRGPLLVRCADGETVTLKQANAAAELTRGIRQAHDPS